MSLQALLSSIELEINNLEEESFLLFSNSNSSQDLGFIDPSASELEITVANKDFKIRQSPTILSSNREGGTTGAVVWRITPLFASWITSPGNLLFRCGTLSATASILELGCGISGIIGLALGPFVRCYTLTDQDYIMKYLSQNLLENATGSKPLNNKRRKKKLKSTLSPAVGIPKSNVVAKPLDWETDEVSALFSRGDSRKGFDMLLCCDCIYNDALIPPLVQSCVDACQLRRVQSEQFKAEPTLCVIAQQLRSPEIFDGWLKAFHEAFHVWRVPDTDLTPELKSKLGFVIHLGILR